MRFAPALVCAWAIQLAGAQVNSQAMPEVGQTQPLLLADSLERGMLALRPIPDVPAPQFDDPLPREDEQRFNTLYGEFSKAVQAGWVLPDPKSPDYAQKYTALLQDFSKNLQAELTKFLKGRIDAAAQYGTQDPRYVAALEDAGMVLLRYRDPEALTLLDKALQLRAAEGTNSAAYWKDLQRNCMRETASAQRTLPGCERALEVRMAQPNAPPMEIASRAQFLADYANMIDDREKSFQYQKVAAEFCKKAGVSPLLAAARFRRLTTLALGSAGAGRIVELNDLTNRYLALGDANARQLMLPSETLKLLEEERHATPATPKKGEAAPTADRILGRYAKAEQAVKTGRLERPIPFDFTDALQVIGILTDPKACATSRVAGADPVLFAALSKSQEGLDFKMAWASATGFVSASMIQYLCGSGGAAGGQQAPGYMAMARAKGVFTEWIAPRKLTVLPGYGKQQTERIQGLSDEMFNASLAPLPADVRQHIMSLPPNARMKALTDYAAQHPGAGKGDGARAAYAGAFTKVLGSFQEMSAASARDSATGSPGFLDLLRADETFVDVYKFRAHEGDRFGPDHYLAIVTAGGQPSRLTQLGPAEPIDTAIDALLSGFGGGGTRGVQLPDGSSNDPAQAWKAVERLVVQPVVAAVPSGARKIFLSPDSALAVVPFASMMLDLGVPVSVSVIPSAYDFTRLRSEPAATGVKRALVVGALNYGPGNRFKPLAATGREIQTVADLASQAGFQTETLSGSQATRAAILERIHDMQVLHLATHGFWSSSKSSNVAEAFRSAGVALSMANTEMPETLLTAEDILRIDLSGVQLVTFSACTSGQGRPVDGQGLIGFQTAFMAAGAQSLLLSLWNVPDEATSVLMQSFYRTLWTTPSVSKSAALRQAQQELRSNPRFAGPRNWAAWVLVGDVP